MSDLGEFPTLSSFQSTRSSYSLPDLLDALYTQSYTGQITLHFRGGIPRSVDLGRPLQMPLKNGEQEGEQES